MHAAVGLFARQGYARTTVREIAAKAGISEGTIYVYYGSKEDLLFAVLESSALQPLTTLLGELAGADDLQVLARFLEDRLGVWERHPALMKVVFAEALHNRRFAARLSRQVIAPVSELVETFVARRLQEGAFRKVRPELVSRMLIGVVFASGLIWGALPSRPSSSLPTRELAQGVADLVLAGMLRRPERSH